MDGRGNGVDTNPNAQGRKRIFTTLITERPGTGNTRPDYGLTSA